MIKETNPTAQDWYLTAWKFLNRVVVTRPRLDIGGAGYITTISKLIHHNVDPSSERLGALSKRDGGAVMGMDLTIGCGTYNVCFVILLWLNTCIIDFRHCLVAFS